MKKVRLRKLQTVYGKASELPLKLVSETHSEIIGRGSILVSSPPLTSQTADLYTGRIVEEAALLSKAHAIIGKEPKFGSDPSTLHLAASGFESDYRKLIDEHEIKCVVEVIGKREPGVEIRMPRTSLASNVTIDQIRQGFGPEFDLRENPTTLEQESPTEVPTIALFLGPEERGFWKEIVASKIADLVGLMNGKLGRSQTDERTGNALD
jgi:hypothetical protein